MEMANGFMLIGSEVSDSIPASLVGTQQYRKTAVDAEWSEFTSRKIYWMSMSRATN